MRISLAELSQALSITGKDNMRLIRFIHPDYPDNKPFEMGIDLANVSTVMNNRATWDIVMENGQKIRMEAEGDGTFHKFLDECQAAKARRDLANMNKR